MIKQTILPLAVLAVCTASCDLGTNGNTTSNDIDGVYNFIVDESDPESTAIVSQSSYTIEEDYNANTIKIDATDIVINNQKYSFESGAMELKPKQFGDYISYKGFSSTGNISQGGATVTDFNGFMAAYYINTVQSLTELMSPTYKFTYTLSASSNYSGIRYFFPLFDYTLNNTYRITTIMPSSCYIGKSSVNDAIGSYSTSTTGYQVSINFAKNLANVYILGLELSETKDTTDPKVIVIEEVPVTIGHSDYSIIAESPTTKIPGTTADGKKDFVESADYKVTDFSLSLASKDLTDVEISYKVAGKNVYFRGSSILKEAN